VNRPSFRGWAAVALAGLSACTWQKSAANLQGQDVHLTVIHTSDVHSRILPYTFAPNVFDKGYGLLPAQGPFGGAARMATLINRERQKSSRSIHLDSGDCFEGAPIFNAFSGEAEMRVMTALGLDAAALGNHEFDRGSDNLATQIGSWSGFPILAANYQFDDYNTVGANSLGQVVKPYTILNVDGLVVGVIGMGNVSSLTSLVEQGNSLGVTPLATDQTTDYYASLLRPQVDVLVAVSHLGLDEDETTALTNQGQKDAQGSQVRGDVDVVFGGHLHIVLDPPKEIPIFVNGQQTNRTTILVHSGAFAKTFGRLDLVVHVNTPQDMQNEYNALVAAHPEYLKNPQLMPPLHRASVKAYDYKVIPVVARQVVDGEMCAVANEDESGQACTSNGNPNSGFCRVANSDGSRKPCAVVPDRGAPPDCTAVGDQCLACAYCHVPEDGEIARILEPYILKLNTNLDLTRTFADAAVPTTIARNASTGGDSQLGNMVATAMRFQPDVQADFALTNSLGIRADFAAGPLTLEEMFNVFPFENTIEIMYLSGNEIQEMFDFVTQKSAARGCQTQAQISGAAFVMDCTSAAVDGSGHPCDPNSVGNAGSDGLTSCQAGKADLILVGSTRVCSDNSQCRVGNGQDPTVNEICGTELGFCANTEDTHKGSRQTCDLQKDKDGVAHPICPSGESCVNSGLPVCGKVLNPNGSYRVAVNDYIAAGGSGFTVLKRNTAKVNTGISLRDALVDYMQRMDDPMFEGSYKCDAGQTPSATTCHGAIRCEDPQWKTDPYLQANSAVTPDIASRYCPGKTTVSDCFGPIVCVLPHNEASDGRITRRLE
jgi:5'-nucleotidase/UDP-sugar diphosphatase